MELNLKSNNNTELSVLYSAQLIADTFAKGLEDNNCLLINIVKLHQKINDTYKDIESLVQPVYQPEQVQIPSTIRPSQTLNPITAQSIKKSKDSCFNCKLQIPKITFKTDLNFSLEDLEAHLNLYRDLFNSIKLDPCQGINLFKDQCIPDILKVLMIILTAYISIMSIKKLGSLSLSMFIKGIISALLGKLIGSINFQLSLSDSGINCYLDYLDNIASIIPTTDNIIKSLNSSQLEGLVSMLPKDTIETLMRSYNQSTITEDGPYYSSSQIKSLINNIPPEERVLLLDLNGLFSGDSTLNNSTSSVNKRLREIKSELTKAQTGIDFLLSSIKSSVDLAIGEFNQMIDNIQGLKTYFECENTRNSENLLDTIRSIKQLIDGLNLLSSIIYALAKKEVRGICKSTKALKQITNNSLTEDDLLLKDFLKDVYQKEVEIINTNPDNIEILVYDKPVYYSLPKIDLLDCSIDEFIKNHTLDAIMDIATQDVLQEDGQERLIVDNSPWESFTFTNILPTVTPELNLITELLYNKPTVNPEVVNTQTNTNSNTFNISPEFKKPELLDNDIKCKNIQDVLNVLETLKGL